MGGGGRVGVGGGGRREEGGGPMSHVENNKGQRSLSVNFSCLTFVHSPRIPRSHVVIFLHELDMIRIICTS